MVAETGKGKVEPKVDVQEEVVEERRQRIPLGTPRMKLNISKPMQEYFDGRNEVLRWINDEPGRLEAATHEDSYRFVTKREFPSIFNAEVGDGDLTERDGIDSRISRVVGTRDSGVPVTAYLMAKPREDYEADMKEKMAVVDRKEEAMKKGVDSYGRPGDTEGRYIPSPGIKITRS